MQNYRDDPDVTLMMRAGRGDRTAFDELVLKYQRQVLNAVFRYTGNPGVAEELAQDVFLRVYRAAPQYRPEARFSTWLFTIVRNLCHNYRSRKGRFDHQVDPDADPDQAMPPQISPEENALHTEMQEKVHEAIQSLPETLRFPLILYQFNHLSYEEIGAVMDLSLSAVKVRIHRARLSLAEKLKPYMDSVTSRGKHGF